MIKVDIDLLSCPNTSWLNTTCIRVVIFSVHNFNFYWSGCNL